MIDLEEFQLSKFTKRGEEILNDVRREFERFNIDDSELPKSFSDGDDAIKLVFVGQYSAGKSSIIKMLTGEDVKIGAGITTQSAASYIWNGLEIIDTPGIDTKIRPDHDEITYEQINHAALLIFVITSAGFSERLGNHFRKLAIDQKRGGNMILVVNKMDCTSQGNTKSQQQIIADDLFKTTKPFRPSDLYVSFLDSSAYFESLEETDLEFKTELLKDSGREIFITNLNRFVEDHKTLEKISKPLYTIANILRNIIENGKSDSKNAIVAYTETLEHRKNVFIDGKRQYDRDVQDIIARFKDGVDRIGRDAARAAIDSGSRDVAERILSEASDEIQKLMQKASDEIDLRSKGAFSSIDSSLQVYEKSSFVQEVNTELSAQIKTEIGFKTLIPGGALATIGALIAQNASGIANLYSVYAFRTITQVVPWKEANIILGKVAGYGIETLLQTQLGVPGSIASELGACVGNVVEQMNLITKTITSRVPILPDTLNKIAQFGVKNAKLIGNVLAVFGVAWQIYSIIKENKKRKEEEIKQRQAREQIVAQFNSIADEISNKLLDSANQWTNENIVPAIEGFDDTIKQIQESKNQAKLASERFTYLLKRVEDLLEDMQK